MGTTPHRSVPTRSTSSVTIYQQALRGLLIGATVVNGIAAGVALDLAIKQLPARRRLGPALYRNYACAADLGNGLA